MILETDINVYHMEQSKHYKQIHLHVSLHKAMSERASSCRWWGEGGVSVGCLQKNGLPLRTREGGYSDEWPSLKDPEQLDNQATWRSSKSQMGN